MYVVCWIEDEAQKWEVVSGEDTMQEFVSDLIENGADGDEIVVGTLTEDTE